MKRSTFFICTLLLSILGLHSVCNGQARGNLRYQRLSMADRRPPLFVDFLVLPGKTDQHVQFASVYSFSYNYLPFKKNNNVDATDKSFYSPVSLNMEIFHANESQLRKKREDISVEGMEPVGRSFWQDTAYVETYEQTQAEQTFLQGHMTMELEPGIYSYVLQLKRGERDDPRLSRTRTIRIESYPDMETGNILLGKEVISGQQKPDQFKLMSMAENVKFGSDFYALAYIPDYNAGTQYEVIVTSMEVVRRDTSMGQQVFSQPIDPNDIRTNIRPVLVSADDHKNILELTPSENGFAYALLNIPNSTFANASYQLTVTEQGSKKPVAKTTFQSMWIDMPRSLLSLEVATDMLHYIVDEKTLNKLEEGSKNKRERKFREFWEKRDPTPKTKYNELMAEYYRRIDYAYQNFTTNSTIGYESDQGRIYIKYGPPKNIERKFPIDGAPVEIWSYPNQQFVFKATTGFGDFKLVSQSK